MKKIFIWKGYAEKLATHGLTPTELTEAGLEVKVFASRQDISNEEEKAYQSQRLQTFLDPEVWDFDDLLPVAGMKYVKVPKTGKCTIHPTGEELPRAYCEAVNLLNEWTVDDALRSFPTSKYEMYR